MRLEERLFLMGCVAWAIMSLGLPEILMSLPGLGSAAGSASAQARVSLAELLCLGLGSWAMLRLKPSRPVLAASALWLALCVLAGLRGWQQGWGLKNVLAESRVALAAPALLLLEAWAARARSLLWLSWLAGCGLLWLWQMGLMLLEPSGLANLSVLLLPAPALEHVMQLWVPCAALVLLLSLRPGRISLLAASLLWVALWLTYIRALWVALAVAALLLALGLGLNKSWREASKALGRAAAAGILGLLLCMAGLALFSRDGAFLLGFRVYRTAQALHLAPATASAPDLGAWVSPQLRQQALHGGLYASVKVASRQGTLDKLHAQAALAKSRDESLGDRQVMRQAALAAWRSSPWLGQGLGALQERQLFGQATLMRDPHSGLLWLLWKLGLLGSFLLALLLAWRLKLAWAGPRDEFAWALGLLALALLCELYYVSPLGQPGLFWILAASALWARPKQDADPVFQEARELLRRLRAWLASALLRLAFGFWRTAGRSSEVKRIYIVEMTRLGDIVSATALIEPLRLAYPDAELHLVGDQAYAGLFAGDPRLGFFGLEPRGRGFLLAAWALRGIWSGPDSMMVLPSPSLRSQLLLRLAKPGRACGYLFPSLAGLGYDERALASSVGPVGRSVLGLSDARDHLVIRAGRALLGVNAMSRLQPKILSPSQAAPGRVLMHAGANWAWRRWPLGRFVALARGLKERGYQVTLIAAEAQGEQPADLDWARPASLLELRELLASAALFVGNDSGPMHLAAALGVPCLALFGPNLPGRSGPWPLASETGLPVSPHRVLEGEVPCRPCSQLFCLQPHDWCLAKIEVSIALNTALSMLKKD